MIDTHCHLDAEQFNEDRDAVMERAFASGVEAIIIPAIAPKGFAGLQALVESDDRLYCGIGIHPHSALEATDVNLALVEEISQRRHVVAIGEIGLDYYYDFAPADVQKAAFRAQIQIAKRHNLPVIIHNREADDDVMRIVTEEQDGSLHGVFHCFSGTPEFAQQVIDLGMHISFTGNITYKKSVLGSTVQAIPLERLIIETDAPYMTPVPHRGKRNEPSFVRHVAEKIAELHSLSIDEVLSMTSQTARRLFHLTLFLLCVPVFLHAQNTSSEDEGEVINPYRKTFGVGFVVGTNTIVESFSNPKRDISYDGLFAYGGMLAYSFTDNIGAEISYIYSRNDKITKGEKAQQYPNLHTLVNLSAYYNFKPVNRMVFYICLGPSYFHNNLNNFLKEDKFGINGGIGLLANIKTSFGLFNPALEWKVSAILGHRTRINLATGEDVEVGFLSSIPCFKLLWYPPL